MSTFQYEKTQSSWNPSSVEIFHKASKAVDFVRHVFGSVPEEQPQYRVVEKRGAFEIREYDAYVAASLEVTGNFESAQQVAFERLARYIFGDNHVRRRYETSLLKRATTTPLPNVSTEIDMTAPVLQEQTAGGWCVSFVLPHVFSRQSAPEPNDEGIRIHHVGTTRTAVWRFSGSYDEASVNEASRKLSEILAERKLHVLSPLRFAGYNPPMTLPFLRRNEVQFDIA